MTLLGAAQGPLDTQTITVGLYVDKYVTLNGYLTGYMGSISDGTFDPTGGTSILGIYQEATTSILVFTLSASPLTNTGWTTMKVNTTDFTRSSASFVSSGGETSWTWSSVTTNPFPAAGNTTTAVFT